MTVLNKGKDQIMRLGLISILVLFVVTGYANENRHSIYLGTGTGTHIGGVIGVGFDYAFNSYFSGNVALGSIHPMLKEKVNRSKLDFDIGLKVFINAHVYFGVNYGFINYKFAQYNNTVSYKEIRGFSYTFGLKSPEFRRYYLGAFVGVTNNKEANIAKVFNKEYFMPRYGLVLGYTF